ncbi:hypothetical protein ABZZ80_35170 [Streptomyces sp. NPDC006356]
MAGTGAAVALGLPLQANAQTLNG